MQVFGVESLYCRENATKKSASADLSVILIYSLFLFVHQKEQATHSSYAHSISLLPTCLVPFCASKGTT